MRSINQLEPPCIFSPTKGPEAGREYQKLLPYPSLLVSQCHHRVHPCCSSRRGSNMPVHRLPATSKPCSPRWPAPEMPANHGAARPEPSGPRTSGGNSAGGAVTSSIASAKMCQKCAKSAKSPIDLLPVPRLTIAHCFGVGTVRWPPSDWRVFPRWPGH